MQVEKLQSSGSSLQDDYTRVLSPIPVAPLLPSDLTLLAPNSTSSVVPIANSVPLHDHDKIDTLHHPNSKHQTLLTSSKVSSESDSISKKLSYHITSQKENCPIDSSSYTLPVHPLLKLNLAEEWPDLACQPVPSGNATGSPTEMERHRNLEEEVFPLGFTSHAVLSGLSGLVAKHLGKPLDKSYQLSDWERRPLWKEQITYAGE